jgi:predicted MFS family arabinose efflux permease
MMSNYFVFPPSASLYTEAMGMTKSASGNILALSPFASIFAGLFLSWWSNKNYRGPLIFATASMLAGNLLYALAYTFNSNAMLMSGRIIFGFGRCRAVNRRYIADYVPKHEITRASSILAGMSSLGFAIGPGIASFLALFPDFTIFGIYFTKFTTPGFFFAGIWAVILILFIIKFEEPPRSEANHRK